MIPLASAKLLWRRRRWLKDGPTRSQQGRGVRQISDVSGSEYEREMVFSAPVIVKEDDARNECRLGLLDGSLENDGADTRWASFSQMHIPVLSNLCSTACVLSGRRPATTRLGLLHVTALYGS
jgi:hypothetical protein